MGMMDDEQDAVKSVLAIARHNHIILHITTSEISKDNSNSRVAFATENTRRVVVEGGGRWS